MPVFRQSTEEEDPAKGIGPGEGSRSLYKAVCLDEARTLLLPFCSMDIWV